MKRTIAGFLFLIALGSGTMFADDGYGRRRDIRQESPRTAANCAATFITGTTGPRAMRSGSYGANIAT
jgi:hypothetical protein